MTSTTTAAETSGPRLEMRLELVPVPVTDVDRAKEFYVRAGFIAGRSHQGRSRLSHTPASRATKNLQIRAEETPLRCHPKQPGESSTQRKA